MSIVGVYEVFGRSANQKDDQLARATKRKFLVQTNLLATDPNLVYQAVGAQIFNMYSGLQGFSDPGQLCKFMEATQRSSPAEAMFWDVSVDFDSITENQNLNNNENPLQRPARITWSFQQFQVPCPTDINGNAALNTAKEPFDPTVVKDDSRPILIIEKNFATFNYNTDMSPYRDKLNLNSFLGFPPRTFKIYQVGATMEYENGLAYWKRRCEMHYREPPFVGDSITILGLNGAVVSSAEISGWDAFVVNQGSLYYPPVPLLGPLTPTDKNGLPMSKPQLLDTAGNLLSASIIPGAQTTYITWQVYKTVDFSGLQMP